MEHTNSVISSIEQAGKIKEDCKDEVKGKKLTVTERVRSISEGRRNSIGEEDKRNKRELTDAWAVKGYAKVGSEFEEWTKSRLEDLSRKKKNVFKWKFETEEEEREDVEWIEMNKETINEEVKILRDKDISTDEKRKKGWDLCCKEMESWDKRKQGVGRTNKRKKGADSPQGGKDIKPLTNSEDRGVITDQNVQ